MIFEVFEIRHQIGVEPQEADIQVLTFHYSFS